MKGLFYHLFLLLFFACSTNKSTPTASSSGQLSYRIVSYNVENLFDTYDEPSTFDEAFTPQGVNHWTNERYEEKVNNIGKVLINSSNGQRPPALIGLVEIENKHVLEDLLNKSPLSKFQYAIVHEDSPDERGIDVALLYDTAQFTYLDDQIGRIQFPQDHNDKTRDILIVKGLLNKDTVYVAINHWPSRRGGVARSEVKRRYVAQVLHKKVEDLLAQNPEVGIIVMGDFNDTPTNRSLNEDLDAGPWEGGQKLINLMWAFEKQGRGSYKYQNQWNMLDQFVISRNLTDKKGRLIITPESARIGNYDWLTEQDPNYPGKRIYRTFRGPKYVGGYSDHYPIVLDIFTQ